MLKLLNWLRWPALLAAGSSQCADARIWTDRAGAQIEAEILEKADSTLTIRRADGRVFTLAIARLSDGDQQFVAGWNPASYAIPSIEEALVLIETPTGSGSGFLAQMGGQVFVLTNQHVIAGVEAKEIVIRTLKKERLAVGRLEVSATLDLARLWVEPRPALLLAYDVNLDSAITAYGNSQGAGVATMGRGRVLSVAADRIEVDAEIVPGNSGGPVLNGSGGVIGVSSYVQSLARTDDWTTANTRYAKVRRFALRPLVVTDWTPVDWGMYQAQMARLNSARDVVERAWSLAAEMIKGPGQGMDADSELPGSLREVVQRQNDHARRIQGRVGDSIRSKAEVDRANESFNAAYRDNLDALARAMESEVKNLELTPPRLSLPYQLQEAREIRDNAQFLIARLNDAKKAQHTFLRASYYGF